MILNVKANSIGWGFIAETIGKVFSPGEQISKDAPFQDLGWIFQALSIPRDNHDRRKAQARFLLREVWW